MKRSGCGTDCGDLRALGRSLLHASGATMKTPIIPSFLSHLPVFSGFPVAFTVAWSDGRPDFRVIDPVHVEACVTDRLCAICGRRLGEYCYYIAGPSSRAHEVFSDPPMHEHCSAFAASICPFLTGQRLEYSDRQSDMPTSTIIEVSEKRPSEMFILKGLTKRMTMHGSLIYSGRLIGARNI